MSNNEKKHPQGYWMGIGMSIGIAIGAALGPVFDNFGVGIGVGVAIGLGLGAALERKYKDNLRPLTEPEKKRQRWAMIVIVGLLVALVSLSAIALLLFSKAK